ncbi:MAG TPA: cation diffusion facilitator family transporter [Bacteroidales bacterium]|nr:cation diffusion facilitator family transporter [Bacteroidales bacterium]HOX78910.1 cation diffusion facilitator family transporter [Bacteroidales bacterium]HPI85047.1 cation diffusion facilitator family transporter [Bacteroidales bacterium]
MNKKVRIARLSIASNTLLIIMKFIVGMISGSVSILSEAIHSLMDLVAAVIAYFSVRVSDNPPDKRHPYGHGKFENLSGVLEALLILVAAAWIVYEATRKMTGKEPVDSIGLGSLVMFISAGVNIFVSRKLYKVAKETDSVALEADALHLKTDVYTSLGVGIGLLLIWITKIHIIDPIIAILVAVIILKEAYELLARAFSPLLDTSIKLADLKKLEDSLVKMGVKYHDLKTRKAGSYIFVEFHLEMPPDKKLEEVHAYCDRIEEELKKQISNLRITIHAEPEE